MSVQVGDLLKFALPYKGQKLNDKKILIRWVLVLFIKNNFLYVSPISSNYWNISFDLNTFLQKKPFIFFQKTKKDNGMFYYIYYWKNISLKKTNVKDNLLKIETEKHYPLIFPWNDSYLYFKNIIEIEKREFLTKLIYKKKFIENNKEFEKILKEWFDNNQNIRKISWIDIIELNLEKLKKYNFKDCPYCKSKLWEKEGINGIFIVCSNKKCKYSNKKEKNIDSKIFFWENELCKEKKLIKK